MRFFQLSGLILLGFIGSLPVKASQLTIEVTGYAGQDGNIVVGLYGPDNLFPVKGESLSKQVTKVRGGKARFVFIDLPKGSYAVVAYHDANGNGEFDKNFLGIPQEKFGFTNDAKPKTMGPPDFEDARFEFQSDKQIETIELMSW